MSENSPFQTANPNPAYPDVIDVSPQEVDQLRDQVALIDVRQPDEFTGDLGHIPSSKLIPLGVFPQHLTELPSHQTVVLICRSGNRSAQAASFAQENGIANVVNMAGGMIAWNNEGLTISKEEP